MDFVYSNSFWGTSFKVPFRNINYSDKKSHGFHASSDLTLSLFTTCSTFYGFIIIRRLLHLPISVRAITLGLEQSYDYPAPITDPRWIFCWVLSGVGSPLLANQFGFKVYVAYVLSADRVCTGFLALKNLCEYTGPFSAQYFNMYKYNCMITTVPAKQPRRIAVRYEAHETTLWYYYDYNYPPPSQPATPTHPHPLPQHPPPRNELHTNCISHHVFLLGK